METSSGDSMDLALSSLSLSAVDQTSRIVSMKVAGDKRPYQFYIIQATFFDPILLYVASSPQV